ncbi:dystonin isoform X10 [Tachysurus vachellii]|uniref:dystonin isoform X10 n=1 Tax=Tachysurus vachellii TaxID=175792 RepID=UPI00296B38B5|nr:dystonin isoform X10 [Tachysurus vachellii]
MNSNLVYRSSGGSSVSNSTLTSLGSAENLLTGAQEPFSSTPFYLNNHSVYGGRLEMLQQIADRVKRDCVAGEDKLVLARASLQSDIKRLESGIQLQNEPEIAGYLLECENLLRQQVVDIQILLDGKFYLADQLVQRVSKLRDHLLTLRTECSSVYSQGRSLSTEQTKMMISGITQSLNSGFSQNLNMGLSPALTPGSALSTSFTPAITPGLTPALIPGLQPTLRVGGSMESGILQHMKHMQIRKPMLKASLVDPSLSEEEVNMKFVQDLLNWVEEMQGQLDQGEWGSDLPSVESHLENHRNVHKAIEDFQMSIKEAQMSEIQMTHPLKQSYSDKLNLLESQYGRLLNSAKERQKYLDSLHNFVSHATQELIWLNEKEEEEVAFDWSERNSNISRKKDYHAELMRELDEKEGVIKSVQDQADILLQQNHPARLTIEAYKAAMQTQWSWILQLCYCVEQHLKENATYIEFFSDAKESMDYLKSLQDSITRKYGCDRTSSLHRLEDLIQESMDEKEQLLQYRSTVAGLVGRSKSIVQLKPRNPENPVRTSLPVKSICDYRQIEITIYKDDECVLANNSHRAKWKVISPSGNEAMVPSVCFTVPPPNKEAADMASRIEQLYQKVLALWHRSHVNMKSVVSWHYLMMDIRNIRKSTVASIKTMLPGEHQQVLSSLQSHFEEFLEDSEESEVFTMADCTQLEREVLASKESYEELLKSAEREEHEESVYNVFISEVRNFRMRVEAHEEQLIRQIRSPLERDDSKAIMQRIADQERKKAELDRLSEDLVVLKEKCEAFLRQAANSPSVPTLSSELNVLTQSMAQVYSMCSIYLEKLKTVNLVVKHSQGAEALVKLYEGKLCEEDAVNGDTRSIDAVMSTLKQWRSEIDERRDVFHDLEDELQKARAISDRMFKTHNERDFDLDWHKEKAEQLVERWRNVHSQIENRLRDLEGMSKSLKYYKDAYSNLDEWTKEMEANQLKTQENQPEDSKALAELLNQQKVLVAEIEHKQSKIDECQKYSEQYSVGVKDYELQLMTYRAMVDSQHKSPVKRRRIQSSSDTIQQDFMDLRTRYTALVTLMTQYVKFASETLKRAEEDEKSVEEERKEHGDKVSKLLNWMSDVNKNGKAVRDDKGSTESCNKSQIPVEEVLSKKEQVTEAIRSTQLMLNKHSDKMSEKEKCEAKEQLKLLHQAHSELSQMSVNQTPAAEQEFEVIEGILDVGKGAVLSVCRAVQTGLIDHCTGLSLLEAQLITSELILPEFHMCLDLDDAFRHNLVDEPMYKQLQDLNEANKRVQIPRYASEPLPAVAAVKDGAISERLAVRIIEIQLATGGLRVTYPGENVSLERAFEFGLIPHSLYIKILQRQNTWKDLIDPNTAEKVSLIQLVQRSIVHEETGLRVLAVKSGKDGSIVFSSGREVSILRATHEGLIDRETMLRLLSAQLSAGGIVDPRTNCKLTVEEALFEGLIDQETASGILSHQAQNGGIINPKTGVRLTVDEAVQCDLMSSRSALLVLEKQKCFMGLLWPHSGEILNVSRSIQHEIITEKLAHEVLCNRHKIAAFYIPENSEVVDIDSAAKRGFINACTVDFLKTVQIPDMFPDVDDLNDRFSSWLVMCELQIDASERSREGLEANEKSTNAPSSLEAKQLFVSFLMMNSYMDPKSGKRLLIFDRQLNKMAKVLLEMSEIDTHASSLDKDFADDLNITGTGELAVLHIDEPLPRIVEGSISEMSIDCDPYVKTIESEGLTTGSAEVFNTSLERAMKAPEIKTSESASEDTNTDACPQYHPHEINPLVSDVEKDAPLIYRENSFQETYKDTTQCSVGCSEKTEHSNLLTEYRQRESVYDEKLERDHVLCLLRDQIKEGGILDVISLKRYNLNDAFVRGLIDDETVLEVLALQLGRQNITRNKTVTMSVLKQAVSEGYISSHIALQIKQQQKLLSDSPEKSISASGACEMGLITDNVGRFVLDSEDAQKAPTDPNGNCDNEADDVKSDEMSALDLSENRPDTESAVNRSEEVNQLPTNPKQMNWSLDSSFALNTICNEEIGAICPSAEILLANSAQLTSGLDSTFLVKTHNEDKIKKHSVEITPVVLSENSENAGNPEEFRHSEESANSNKNSSIFDSPFILNSVGYADVTAEEFDKNSLNAENAMKRPDEAIHLLAPSTELTNSSDSSLTLKTVSAEEVNDKRSSNKYGLMTTAESNALLSNLTQFTSSSESSLKTVIGEGISEERFDDKSLKTENELKQTEKASNLLATRETQLADSLDTSFTLKTASDKDIIDGDFSDKGLHAEDEMITLEDNYLSANSAQINSSLDTSFKADSDDKLFHDLGEKCPNTESAIKQPEDTQLPKNSKQITCGLDSLLLLNAGSDVEITVLEKESFEISVVNSEKCASTDNAVNRTEDTHLSANTKQVISSEVGEEITTVKFLEKSPSNENTPDEVSSLLTTSTHLTSTMDYVDKLTAGEFGEKSLSTENTVTGLKENLHPLINTTQMPSSLDLPFLLTMSGDDLTAERFGTDEIEMKRTEQNNPALMTSSLNSTLLFPVVSDEFTGEKCPSSESSLNTSFTLKITNEEFAKKCPSAENTMKSTNEVSPLLRTPTQIANSFDSSFTLKTACDDEITVEKDVNKKQCKSNESELKTLEESTNTTTHIYSLNSLFTLKAAVEKCPSTKNGVNKRTEEAFPPLMSSSLETSFTLNSGSKEMTDDTFGEKSPSTENSSRTTLGTPLSTDLTQMSSSLDPSFTLMTDNFEICAKDLSKKCPSSEHNSVKRTEEATSLSLNTTQDTPLTLKTDGIEMHGENYPSTGNSVNRTEEATPQLTGSTVMTNSLDSSFSINAKDVTNYMLNEKCPGENADEASFSTHLTTGLLCWDSLYTFMKDSDEIPAEDLSEKCPGIEDAVVRAKEAVPRLQTPTKMISSLDASFTLKADSDESTNDAFGKKCPNTENAEKTSEADSLSTNLTQMTNSLDSSSTLLIDSDEIPAEEFSKKCPSSENTVNKKISSLGSSLTLKTDSVESPDGEICEKCTSTENVVNRTEKDTPLSIATQMDRCLDSSFILKTDNDITKELLYGICSSTEVKRTKETNCLSGNTENALNRTEEVQIHNSTNMISSLDSGSVSEAITDQNLSGKCPSTENLEARPEVTAHVLTDTTQMTSLNSKLLLKTISDTSSAVDFDPGKQGLEDLGSSHCLDIKNAIDKNHTELGDVPEKENYLSFFQAPLTSVGHVAFNEAAVNQKINSAESESGISFSLQSDNSDKRNTESLQNIHKQHSAFSEKQQTVSIFPTEGESESMNAMEEIKKLTDSEPSLSSSTLVNLSDTRAASKTNVSPESSEKVKDQEQSVLSRSVDINERQTNEYKKDLTQCTISKTDVIGLEPEHECKSGTANDHAAFKAVVTQSSHTGVSVDNEIVNDIVLVNTSESMDMFKECLHSKVCTSPTSKFLPDVTLSDDSIFEQHLAEQGEVSDTAIELCLPNSGFVISETNRYDAGSLECKTTIIPAHIMGEESSKSVTLKPNIPPNFPHKDSRYVEHYGDKLCVNTSMMESKFTPVYEKELEQTTAKGAVNEIQRKESHALDLNESVSSTAATPHDSQILVENKDPAQEPSSPVLKQPQLQEMIQEMSEPEMLKEPLGWLGTTGQGDEGSLVEGVVQPKAAAGDSCEDDIFPSAWSSQQSSKANVATTEEEEEVKFRPKECSTQHYLECVGKLQDHYDTLEDIRNDFLTQSSLAVHIEGLQEQLEAAQSLVAQLAAFPASLTSDLKVAEQLLNSADELIPTQVQQDLAAVFVDLKATFTDVCHLSSERHNTILQAIDAAKGNLECTFQDLLSSLEKLSSCIQDNHEIVCKLDIITTDDFETVKYRIQQNKDLEKNLSGTRQNLEDTAFDVQNFISEHAQFLNPAQNRQMLKCLSATQRAFKELMERVFTQRHALDLHLEICEDEIRQQNAVEKQKEFVAKLQELCDDLTQTENRLIGHQQQSSSAKSVGDIQQHQQENQALQKDIQVNVNALNEVISSTKKFLEENRSKLTPEQVAAIELKLEEVKCKSNMLNQRAEETRKELEKVVTTVIKQETEKVAAVEQLEETKNKIEVLLDWVSNIGKETEMAKENGNMPVEGKITGVEDDPNGNALDATDNTSQWSGEDNKELDMDQQYERLKAHHQEILSQQQDLIIATQSAQALLDKQADVLSPSEKEQLQKSIQELRECYEVSLTQAEQQMKQIQSVQEELHKFEGDYEEFGVWLQQAQEQLAELGAPTGHLAVLQEKLEKQKCFYEDVISHKGDLRFITISGQKVLDVAKACSRKERKQGLLDVDTSGTCAAVKEKLDSTATRYKAMHTQCNQLGNNLKDVVEKYKKYEDAASCLLSWLNSSEADARRQQSEPIAADPQILQRQLEETKALQGQTTGHQVALETLRKTADALITAEGDLLNNKDELQEAVDDIVERYDNLSKSVSDRNEKLQVTLTRSLSVQDGLDEMMNWMKRVEENVGEGLKVPLDSAAIADALSKEAALEQDMSSRQSSISTMKAKVKKFVETAEPAAAAALQTKMEGLTQRFDNACEKHKQKISQMEQLKDKVEQFEKTSEKVQGFVLKHSHALYETDGPGKNVNELSQLVQDINVELAEHVKDMETLNLLAKELSNSGPEGSTALIQGKMANLSNTFNTFKDTVKEKEEEVLSCQDQLGEFKVAAGVLMKWLEETKEQVPLVQPNCSEQGLGNDVKKVNGLLEEWTAKAPAVQDINSKGSALCTLISVLTSPAKARMHHKPGSAVSNGSGPGASYLTNNELILVEQNMSSINEDYSSLGELLKTRSSELSGLLLKVQGVQNEAQSTLQWLENMKKTAVSWNSEPAGKDTMKIQIERQKAYEENMLQKQQQYQELRKTLLHLIEESPDSPEAEKWKNMLKQIDAGWEEVKGSVENRKQHLEESSRMLELFQTNQPQLSQWLLEKDLMMSVLGPLSMDPNMLNMQKQQVQILLKEFEGRKPQYEQLNEAAMVISSASGNQDPTGEKVKKQLDAITQKWQALTSQLSDRDALIQQAVGKTTQFQDLLRQLGESAADLELQLNGQQTLSTQPDAVKKQLEATNAVLAKLCEEKKRLKEAESLCSELSALVTEEYLRANLTAQLESISKPFKILEDKAGKRIQHLTSTFASSQEFHRTSKDFQGWIEQMFKEQAKPQSVSAKEETLLQSLREHIAIQSALSEQEEQYNNIMREAEALLQNTEGEEKLALQGQLSALRSNWEKVKRGAMERAEKLNVAIERAKKYKEHAESLGTWLQECEDRSNKAKFSVDPVEVENSLSQVKAIQRDVDKHRGQMELLNVAADSLLEVATADVDDLQEEKIIIGNNMDKLIEGLQLKKETLEKLSQKLKEFSDTDKEISDQMEGARKQLEYHSGLGEQGYSNKNLTNMKAQQKNLEGVQNQIENLKSIAQSLIVDVPEVEGVVDLLLQADTLEKEHSSISKAIEDKCNTLENKLQGIGQFQDNIREMFTTFADLDDELDSMGPVARDLKTLQDQEGTIQNFVTKLQDLINNTACARENCKKMLESEVSPDLLGLKRDLEALSKQSGKLMDRAIGRKEQVEETLRHLQEFYHKLDTFTTQVAGAEEQEESQGPVGMETDFINQQLEAFKVFQKETIDSLQTQLQEVNCIGQGLIQNASKGTNTTALERDLEDINMRWNTLNKKVAERSAQLHEALLHCGRFQDALESLFSWLKDTEELVASQKPPSAEFKVVKAQIQEQRLLQKLLDDRRPTVELIKKEGGKVLEMADSVDKEKIGKEIDSLGKRWDALLKKAETRRKQCESILGVAQQFHETLEPLTEWLTATEKCLTTSEPIGTQTSKLEEQISQHKALEEEIIGHSKSLYQAISLGQALRSLSCVDDKELIQAKLDSTQGSYIELQERCRMKAELLQRALANARLFGEDEVALMNWLDEIHGRLNHISVQDYAPAILAKQHADQLALHEDIELRRQHVEQALQNGLELLKQTTGDEVVVIQGKLDGIKTRYADISTMSSDVMKTLDKALSLANKVQHTHEDLHIWLEKVESELATFGAQEPVGEQLTQVQERQKALLKEVQAHKSLVDTLNEVSSALLELVPWRAREGLDKLITEDNERYRSASDAISQHVDQTGAAILKSQQFEQAADTELAWLTEAEKKLSSLGDIKLEVEKTAAQLQAQKGFSMDIMRHKDAVDDLTKTGEAIMNSKDETEKLSLKAKIQALVEKYNSVSQLNSERCLQLERVHSLACQFWETYEELWPWLQETRANFTQLPSPAIEYETLRQQQEELRQLRELIAEHKPHIDKMNKTGPQLVEISPLEGEPIREKFQVIDKLYAQLKADVKHRAAALDEAISQSTQFHDKIDPMLESLNRIAERLRQPPSISVEVEKIREQISENKAVNMDLEKLQPSYETLKQRGEEMITRSEGADKDLSAKAVQDKLDQMVFVWSDIHALLEEREAKLLDVMDLAEKFWCDHCALIITIKDTQDLLKDLEEPGVDPSVVKQQQESVEGYREEIDGLQDELNVVQNLGAELMTACGEPDKPVIKKSIDEVNMAWETLNKTWKERVDRLEEAMQAAVQFQDGLQGMFDWVDILASKLDSMSPVGTDLETVKQQIEELKEFKGEAYQLQIEMERLNHQAGLLLKKVLDEEDRIAIQEPMNELKMLWENLDDKVINRQHKLEGALLALGQFQHALDELLAWLTNTEELLSGQKKTSGDPKSIEIELAKHHVLHNDVLAHKTTVEAVNKAGRDLIESSAGEEACGLQSKLENLNQRWTSILEKTEQRKQLLDSTLLQAQGFHGEIEDMQQWLKDTECQLLASKAVGGLPDTAREQLNTHLELCRAMEVKEELYQKLIHRDQQLKAMTPENQDSGTEQDLLNLREKWECVQSKVAERKVKLEEALAMATDFHNSLQDFINWLTQAEQTLNMGSPASLILETILFQIDEHKIFVTEVNSHRDQIIELDKTGTHLKYFSQKQDVVLIKNLLLSVQSRWDKVVQRSVERGRLLDDARKRAKQFHESWAKLMEWLEESERALDSELEIANDPDKIKMQLAQHKDFQKALGAKHSVYDTTSRTGRALKDKTSLQDDNQKLDGMLCELRDKWDTICGKSVERQNKLEEALLFSGQFTDALQALIDWLYKIEPQLAEDQPVHGDIDLVLNLIDSHKVFQKELGKRTGSVQALKRSARELIENRHDDSSWVKVQMQELSLRWETVCSLSVLKQTRLEQALCQAEEFHSTVHILLEWLAEAEQSLRFHGSLPEDEEALRVLIEQHKEFIKKLEEKSVALGKAISMGEDILAICHPDSITTVKHWNTIIKARFEEVTAWARQHQQRLSSALSELMATQELLENLLSWLQWAETTVTDKDKEALPQEIEEIKALITEHQTFMEEMTRKQPDVDKVTKTHKRKATADAPVQSQIPVLEKGRTYRKKSQAQSMYPATVQAQIETKNPRVNLLMSKWQQVWLLALDRRRKLNDALDRLEELKEFANFDFDIWRKRYMRWMNHKKSRVMDFFRRMDKDQDGKVTRQEFIDGILSSKFPTSRLEMSAVADIFDRDGDGYIDYYEFVAALHPNKDAYKPLTDADKIEDEVTRQVAKCKCPKRFQVEQIGANKYRFYLGNQFGDSQQLRLVRILRSTVMVRVGGGWMALDEFLVKNDPCRAKGRTNVELREKFILPEGTTQVMASFRYRGRRSRPSSRGASPNRSNSSHSCPAQPNPAVPGTPKTLQHLTRNYDKPWLTNSKSATPLKSSDSFESQGSSNESTPIQGSRLRLPGYLSGKGFQSGEEGTLINTAILKARNQTAGLGKIPSRPGSKAGSRGSSRRGSDASDFDISDIQSVCSDMSETVMDSARPRSSPRQPGVKPSKIPTPQRRSRASSKLAKTTATKR